MNIDQMIEKMRAHGIDCEKVNDTSIVISPGIYELPEVVTFERIPRSRGMDRSKRHAEPFYCRKWR